MKWEVGNWVREWVERWRDGGREQEGEQSRGGGDGESGKYPEEGKGVER